VWTENSPVCHFCPSLWTDKSGQCRLFSIYIISLFLLLFAHKTPSPFPIYAPQKPLLTHRLSILQLNQATFDLPGSAIIRPTQKPSSAPPAEIPFINSEKNTVGVNNVCKILGFSRVRVRVNVSVRVILVCIMISLGDSIW